MRENRNISVAGTHITDLEEEYHLYGRETDTYKIYVKVFKDYMTNEIWSSSKDILNEL